MTLRDLSLEMSLKAFTAHDGSDIDSVLETMFLQWEPLARQSGTEEVTVMLWVGDGSEILDYRGDPDGDIPWGAHIGNANPHGKVANDPEGIDPHSRNYPYHPDPVPLTYRRLAQIIARCKAVGARVCGVPIRVCATFDPGPEFAKSTFKYERHPEICAGNLMGKASFVGCYARLHADRERYAAYPDGIPEGLPLGEFLGHQAKHFLDDLGYDQIWFSNGFGFGIETWSTIGAIFDGQRFDEEKRFLCRDLILDFWRRFRAGCPDHEIRVRGTNLTTGIDLSSDGAPIREIYRGGFNCAPPPNSPWAALDGNFGLELAGWMSHIAELPGEDVLFRFYTHDPWWKNSPWIDRYDREPHDLWLPLGVARIDSQGEVRTPTRISMLTVDDSFGRMPEKVPREVTPHILDALEHAPDAPPPTVWVYPFDEYHDCVFGSEPRLSEPFAGDWLIVGAINEGLPLNAVTSSACFLEALSAKPDLYRDSVLVSPVPDGDTALSRALIAHVRGGGKALFYGPATRAGEEMLALLGLDLAVPVSGELTLHCLSSPDREALPSRVIHREQINAGGVEAVLAAGKNPSRILAAVAPVSDPDLQRVASLHRADPAWKGGELAWVRGTVSASHVGGNLLVQDDPSTYARSEVLLRYAWAELGWEIGLQRRDGESDNVLPPAALPKGAMWDVLMYELAASQRSPVIGIHRHQRALWLSGFMRDTTTRLRMCFPDGAPLLVGCDAWIEDGRAEYNFPRAWRRECRVLVRQRAPGMASCRELTSEQIGMTRRLEVRGLRDATVTFLPLPGTHPRLLLNSPWPYVIGEQPPFTVRADGAIICPHLNGRLLISW